MSYKIIDGVVYEIKEADISSLKTDVAESCKKIEELEKAKCQHEANMKNTCSQYDAQIESYMKQIDGLQALIETIKEKKDLAIKPHETKIHDCELEINSIKESLLEKKEVIEFLLPDESKKLGL